MYKKVNLLFNYCNARCGMCSMNFHTDHNRILSHYPGAASGQLVLAEYKAFFDAVKKEKPSVSIAGGEPLMYPDIVPLADYVVNQCRLPAGITTNGTVEDMDKLNGLVPLGVNVTFSIDGLAETHNRSRGEGSFEKAIKSLDYFNRLRQDTPFKNNVNVLFVLHKKSYQDLEAVIRLLMDDIGIGRMTVSALIFSSESLNDLHNQWVREKGLPQSYCISNIRCGDPSYLFNKEELAEAFEMKEELKSKYSRVAFEPDFVSLQDMEDYFLTDKFLSRYFSDFCRPVQTNLTLISNGDILFFPGCYEMKLGNIKERGVQEIWDGHDYKELRAVMSRGISPVCSHCCSNRVEKV